MVIAIVYLREGALHSGRDEYSTFSSVQSLCSVSQAARLLQVEAKLLGSSLLLVEGCMWMRPTVASANLLRLAPVLWAAVDVVEAHVAIRLIEPPALIMEPDLMAVDTMLPLGAVRLPFTLLTNASLGVSIRYSATIVVFQWVMSNSIRYWRILSSGSDCL
jgi:hypothetical protein